LTGEAFQVIFAPMSTLLEIEKAIENLPSTEFRKLHRWVSERDSTQWDEEIAADANAGKFDELRQRVRSDYEAGRCSDL
jgi:hypothetical protein